MLETNFHNKQRKEKVDYLKIAIQEKNMCPVFRGKRESAYSMILCGLSPSIAMVLTFGPTVQVKSPSWSPSPPEARWDHR